MERKTNREQFYQASLRLFFEKGYKATSMRNIADKLDIQAPTLYNYVKSKHDILENILFDIAGRFHKGMKDIYDSSYSPTEKLKAVVALNVRLTTDYPYHVYLLVAEWKHLNEDRRDDFLQNRKEYEGMLRNIISEGIEKGDFRSMNLEIAMEAILSSIRWLFHWYSRDKEDVLNPIELEKQMLDFILYGVSTQNS
ncbi:MAG: TetR/AcrR family transcriptional regulator [Bacteroidia bacterium]|nr:TetR/AcrR family transcriptional regulator [Bacteroidia bacterium]